MPIDIEEMRAFVERAYQPAVQRYLAIEAMNCFEDITQIYEPTERDIGPIINAATSEHVLPGTVGVKLLLDLATNNHAGLDAALGLVTDSRWSVRNRIVAGLHPDVPTDLATELCRFAIHDASSRVRVKAAERIEVLELDLLDELREQVRNETHRTARSRLEWHLDLATLGYHVTHGEDGSIDVAFRLPEGRGYGGFTMTTEEMAAGRLHERIAEERERHIRR